MCALRLFMPLRCHHCYHTFSIPWILTVGKRTEAPILKFEGQPGERSSYAVQQLAEDSTEITRDESTAQATYQDRVAA